MRKSLGTNFLLLFLCFLLSVICVLYCHSDFANSLQLDSLTVLDSVMASDIPKRKVKRSLQANCVENNDHQEEHQIKSRRWNQVCQPIMVEGGQSAQTSNKNLNILEHRDKRIRRNQFNPTVILDQTLFAHGSSTADSTSIIGVSRHLASSNATQLAEIEEMRGMDHQIKSRRSKRWKQVSHSIMVEENQVGQTSNENVTVFENNDKWEIAETRGERSHSYGQAFYQRTKQAQNLKEGHQVAGSHTKYAFQSH